MSDGFDKEAEREKLRKKFAKDEKKRENTQRMSELLLKGATMTNRHCEECGDPIFRHDGREFCPTCHAPAEDGSPNDVAAVAGSGRHEGTNATNAPDATNAAGTAAGAGTDATNVASDANASNAHGSTPADADTPSRDPAAHDVPSSPSVGAPDRDAAGDLATARESLVRTLTRFSRAAEGTEDPRRAREHLRAAREAAETLRALE